MFEVLILEDEEYNREFLKKIIGELQEVTALYATSSGEEAIELAQKHNKPCLTGYRIITRQLEWLNCSQKHI